MVAVGRGGGEQCMRLPPPGRAPPRLLPREPPLLRGNPGKGPVWFSLPGRGFPPRAPPRAISPRSGVRDGAGGGRNRGRHPGQAFPGISRLLPPSCGAGEERTTGAGRGWGDRRTVYGEMPAKGEIGAGPPGLSPREPRSSRSGEGAPGYGRHAYLHGARVVQKRLPGCNTRYQGL